MKGDAADYSQTVDLGVKSPGDLVSATATPPGKVLTGHVVNPGGFVWTGGPATFNGTIPMDFAGAHAGKFRGTYQPEGGGAGRLGGKPKIFTWEMDTRGTVIDLLIIQPAADENHAYLAKPDYNSTGPVAFKARVEGAPYAGKIAWEVKREYKTDAGDPYEKTYEFNSPNDQAVNRTFTSEGGRLTIKAVAVVNGVPISKQILNYVTGVAIPDATITKRLRTLYTPPDGGTKGLLTGIAMAESSYRQFAKSTKYALEAKWPVESPKTKFFPQGAYIGMMQVPVALETAWDWLVNTKAGAAIFAEKLQSSGAEVAKLQATRPGLPDLTGVQLENYALGLYVGARARYYSPVQVAGRWQWQTTKNQDLLKYVARISDNVQ